MNQELASANREKFAQRGTLVLNLVSSPGSGKTSLIEETVKAIKADYHIFVLTGDLMTENDARRVERHGVKAVQISTGDACHLDARMVDEKLLQSGDVDYDLILIENVGNLVCPTSYYLGEDDRVSLISAPTSFGLPATNPTLQPGML